MNSNKTPAIILSGGSEIISISLAEELLFYNIPLIVISLGKKSIIRDISNVIAYVQIDWPPNNTEATVRQLIEFIKKISAKNNVRYPTFATEDSGLRFLLEHYEKLSDFMIISASQKLKMGGLDKAELFEHLLSGGLGKYIASTVTLNRPDDLFGAFDKLGMDLVVKPALKPYSMILNIGKKGEKVINRKNSESDRELINRLSSAWNISDRWVAQKKLDNSGNEACWWGHRTKNGKIVGITAYEIWKYPRYGGTGCWVKLSQIDDLHKPAHMILNNINYIGLAEMPFLKDYNGNWRLLELNPRPWLQVALPARAGLPLAYLTYCDFLNISENANYSLNLNSEFNWVNAERLIMAATSGDYGGKIKTFLKSLKILIKSDCKIVYDSPFYVVKIRWIIRMIQKILKK